MRKVLHTVLLSILGATICALAPLTLSNNVSVPNNIMGFPSSDTTTGNAPVSVTHNISRSTKTSDELTASQVAKDAPANDAYDVCNAKTAPGTAHCNALVRRGPLSTGGVSKGATVPAASLGDSGAYSPKFLQSAYNVASVAAQGDNGSGQIIGVVDAFSNPNLIANLNYYRRYFGLAPCVAGTVSTSATNCVIQVVNEQGGTTLPATSASWGMEETIDVDMVSAICANCELLVVDANSAQIQDLGPSVNTAVQMGAVTVVNSYGTSEYPAENNDANLYYNHPGVAIVVAAGDSGYGVQFPAAAPDVVSVGGTTLVQNTDSGTRNGSEVAWSGTASGCSAYEPKPVWQHDTKCANRSVADVAAVADPNTGVWIYDTFGQPGLMIAGGTSVAAPIVGSLFALANKSMPSSSYAVSFLYASPGSLVPVTSGSDGKCGSYLCNAALSVGGYNGPTGLGTPGASPNSVPALSAPMFVSSTSSSATTATTSTGEVATSSNVVATQVSAGTNSSCSVLQGGTVQCWGQNSFGQLGNNSTINSSSPVTVTGLSNVTEVSVGESHACAVLTGGLVKCWGSNSNGQLGVASVQQSSRPVTVKGITSATSVAAGYDYTCAVLSTGSVWCWGSNEYGQAGHAASNSVSTPMLVQGITNATQVAVSVNHTCAALTTGNVECWGSNGYGQLGNGTSGSSAAPVQVSGLSGATQVATGASASCALLTSGSVECWGFNSDGELGNASTVNSSTPVIVSSVSGATSVSMGAYDACAVAGSGSLRCWGFDAMTLFGTNGVTSANALAPAVILSKVSNASLSSSGGCVIGSDGTVRCWSGAGASLIPVSFS